MIKRMIARCLFETGELRKAEQQLSHLVQHGKDPLDIYSLFQVQLSQGKASEASATARVLLGEPAVASQGLLRIAHHLQADDPSLARQFFEEAKRRGISDGRAAGFAITLAYRLGLEDEIRDLFQSALKTDEGGEVGFKAFSWDDFVELQKGINKTVEESNEEYKRGSIPIHIFANRLDITLAALYHDSLVASGEDVSPIHSFALRTRHGSRCRASRIPAGKGMFMDISSLLLAEHLGVLQYIEASFQKISVSRWLMDSLRRQMEKLGDGQPTRAASRKEVQKLVEDKRISLLTASDLEQGSAEIFPGMGKKWSEMLDFARRQSGFLMGSMPLASSLPPFEPVSPPVGTEETLCGPGDLLQTLAAVGALTEADEKTARARLGVQMGEHQRTLSLA
ncbi:MAG: hypothetical protein EOP84_30225, partial [Verrucomicrobiaceae bacterium]